MTVRRSLSGPELLAAVAGAWLVALLPWPPGLVPAGTVLAATLVAGLVLHRRRRTRWAVLLVVAVVAAHAASASAVAELPPGRRSGRAVLVADPEPHPGGATVLAEVAGLRLQLRAGGRGGASLLGARAGEWLDVAGEVRALDPREQWLADRHVVGVLELEHAGGWAPAAGAQAWANRARAWLRRGAVSLDDAELALFTGLVYGDDRNLDPADKDAFTAAGLTHLTAVSGQNVAFVLAVAGPLLRRLPFGVRSVATPVLLGAFTLLTRADPSVLRAVVMAGVAGAAVASGRVTSGLRSLGIAVVALLAVDPLLARRPGFVLSVVASAGILVGARRIAERLPGPRSVRDAVGVTVAAQVATAPVLAMWFGTVPVAALPANLLAGPAAGAVMMYGLAAGAVAGVAAACGFGAVAAMVHRPTALLVGWLQGVADRSSALVPGELGPAAAVALVLAVVLAVAVRRRAARVLATVVVVVVLGAAAAAPWRPAPVLVAEPVARGAVAWRGADAAAGRLGVLALDGRADPDGLLRSLRALDIRWVDLVVVRSPSPTARAVGQLVEERLGVGALVAPDPARPEVPPPVVPAVAGLAVAVDGGPGPWRVVVEPAGGCGPSG